MNTYEVVRIGDYGYFWDNNSECFVYGKLLDTERFANPDIFLFKVQLKDIFFHFEHFSTTPPLSVLIKNIK